MSDELKPCPFCDGKPEYACEEGGFTAYLTVLCRSCGAESGQVRYRSYDNGIHPDTREYVIPPERKQQAAAIWNRRTVATSVDTTAPVSAPTGQELPPLPDFMRRDIERAIKESARPKGMSVHDGKARIGGDRLQRLLTIADTYAERIRQLERELAERASASIGSDPEFKRHAEDWCARLAPKLIAYIDERK